MTNKPTSPPPPERYGVEAELERLMSCPECGSRRVRPNRSTTGGYGFFGFKAIGDLSSTKDVVCRNCGHEWLRPPIKELRIEAERRVDERYERFAAENARLLAELEQDRATNFAPTDALERAVSRDEQLPETEPAAPGLGSMEVTPDARPGKDPAN